MSLTAHVRTKRRLIFSLSLFILVIIIGTSGYTVIEGWPLFDSFYMTVITLATIGYNEVHPLSNHGRLFNIFVIMFGVGVVAYTVNAGMRFIFEGEILDIIGRQKLVKKLKELRGHYILCGFGRMGRIIYNELKSNNIEVLIIEQIDRIIDKDEDILALFGDATKDEILREAAIERAKGLITVLPTDAQNLFVVLSARGLNPSLYIVARAGEDDTEKKLYRAGADKVVSPYHIGGLKMAHCILKPTVVDFIEFATRGGNIGLQMGEIKILSSSSVAGQTIDQSGIGRRFGIIIVAIKRSDGSMDYTPTHKTMINNEDTLIVLGESTRLARLEELARV